MGQRTDNVPFAPRQGLRTDGIGGFAEAVAHWMPGTFRVLWPKGPSASDFLAHAPRRLLRRLRATVQNPALFAGDLALAALSLLLAAALRLGLDEQVSETRSFDFLASAVPWFVVVCAVIFPCTCLYNRNWRYASIADLMGITRAVCLASLALVFWLYVVSDLGGVPRSLVVIEALILIPLLSASRLRFKLREMRRFGSSAKVPMVDSRDLVPVLIVGAGDMADHYIRALQRDDTSRHWPVGLLDTKSGTDGYHLRGVPVLGKIADFDAALADLERRGMRPRHLIFTESVASFSNPDMEKLVDRAQELGIAISRPASTLELRSPKRGDALELRPIAVTDLLERPQAALDQTSVRRMITGCRVAITGCGGSIGSELTLQVAALHPSEIVLIDACELNLYTIDMELKERFPDLKRTACLCNVREFDRLLQIFGEHRPELVFHAAALKHVPMVELNPCEGALTNIIGSMNVARATKACRARAMVQISTDKVVNTTNVMGATKRLAELYCQALDLDLPSEGGHTRFMTVRFGNVLGSSGSLIPLFERQLARGGPLTVTDPEMKRFFMTIREAVELTLHASAYGLQSQSSLGEIFVLDMGEPIKIIDMAERMIKLAGYQPGKDIRIEIVGCRPGEKLFEELFDESEERVPLRIPGVMGAIPNSVALDVLDECFARIRQAALRGDREAVIDLISEILPSYRRPDAGLFGPISVTGIRQSATPANSLEEIHGVAAE
jgi:FlaA1/EpsC-like NDP-sugar epimerase